MAELETRWPSASFHLVEDVVALWEATADAASWDASEHQQQVAIGSLLVVSLAMGVLATHLFLRSVNNSPLDATFKMMYKIQAMTSLLFAISNVVIHFVTFASNLSFQARIILCRGSISLAMTCYLCCQLSLLLAASLRLLYVLAPLFVHKVPQKPRQIILLIGYLSYASACYVNFYYRDVLGVVILPSCIGYDATVPLKSPVSAPAAVLTMATTCAYCTLAISKKRLLKVPHPKAKQKRNRITLNVCAAHFFVTTLIALIAIAFNVIRGMAELESPVLSHHWMILVATFIMVMIAPSVFVLMTKCNKIITTA